MSSVSFAQGTFLGDGTTGRAIPVGFQPKVVTIRGNLTDTAAASLIRFASPFDDCVYIAGTFGTSLTGIASLTATGFTVNYVPGQTYTTNKAGITYYWEAWGGDLIAIFTYTGDANPTQSITGIGFQPAMVWVWGTLTGTIGCLWWCQDSMGANLSAAWNNANGVTNAITSLDADGFTIGNHAGVHTNGRVYCGIAFAAADNFVRSTYTGNGSDNRNLPASPMAFDPEFVGCRRTNYTTNLRYKNLSLLGDASFAPGTGAAGPDQIQSLTPETGKFQVGTGLNASTAPYHFFAFNGHVPQSGVGVSVRREGTAGGRHLPFEPRTLELRTLQPMELKRRELPPRRTL